MARSNRIKLLAIATVAIIALIFIVPSSPLYYNPQASSSGIHLKGCLYDSSGNQIGCNSAFKVPIGQSVTGAGGASIASIRIPSAYATLNYTGQPTSITLKGTEQVSYAKGMGESFAISYSSTSPVKSFNITLPKSSWTADELEAKWGSTYGTKLVNVTIANPTLVVKFSNGITITRVSAFNYQVQFTLNYGQKSSTSTTYQTTTTTITQTATSTITQTSTTTISDGGVSSGTIDVWTTTITSASGGATGNIAPNGVIVSIAPDYYFETSQSVMWEDKAQCPNGFFATLVTPSQSLTRGRIQAQPISFPTQVIVGELYLVQIECADSAGFVFNQVVTASSAQPSNAAPSPPFPAATTTTTTSDANSNLYITDLATCQSFGGTWYGWQIPALKCVTYLADGSLVTILSNGQQVKYFTTASVTF